MLFCMNSVNHLDTDAFGDLTSTWTAMHLQPTDINQVQNIRDKHVNVALSSKRQRDNLINADSSVFSWLRNKGDEEVTDTIECAAVSHRK